jgi:acyl-coenzyme A synthetase/AMP-(fatty) acid ligase
VSEASLRQACAAELARYKVPDRIVFATRPLPRNAMSKVVKRELRSLFE